MFSSQLLLALSFFAPAFLPPSDPAAGTLPADASGRPLNFDFETGTLKDWTAQGEAFAGQPIEGDLVHRRRSDMNSAHAGRYWVGSFERKGDIARGTLTSVPFKVTKPFATFLIAGGANPASRVELVRQDTQKVVSLTTGDDTEVLKRVAVDLTPHLGREVYIRLVDESSNGWGHVNFDDFRLHDSRPSAPQRPTTTSPDQYAHSGLAPEEAARAMTVPEGFKVTLFAGEPDVVQPIAFALDDRGRVWVAEAYSYPHRVPDAEAKDRILIFEDTNGDGTFDTRKVFADRLNLVSGIELGFGGVWVGAAPEFLFIPDRDGDDRPDGPPEVVLDGWGQHDTHETLNSFNWGPDGWLYGCHGVFTFSRVGKPGTPDRERIPINAGIWRYHPQKRQFEVFAHGTSNPWGVDFDDHGEAFLTACVIPHLYHVAQGGRYERQAGQHDNPYTYDDIKTIADHRHWVGTTPHSGNGRSDQAGGGHAHSGAMIYLGGSWPSEYRGSLFMNNIHGARLNRDILTPKGSGFVGSHAPDFLRANDVWSQIVSLRYGRDGSVYMIDWYDKNQCHRVETEMHDRTNGRIFKIAYAGRPGEPPMPVFGIGQRPSPDGIARRFDRDLAALTDGELLEVLGSPNDFHVRHARRILEERSSDPQARRVVAARLRGALADQAFDAGNRPEPRRLRSLWALHVSGGLDEEQIASGLADKGAYIRAWTIQLACEDHKPSAATLARFAELARSDPSPVVRLYLASALQRLPIEQRWEVLASLLSHPEDARDVNLPLMNWYAAEPLAAADPTRAAALASEAKIPLVQSFMTRRIASIGTGPALALLVRDLARATDGTRRLEILREMNEALKGRRTVEMPLEWAAAYKTLVNDRDAEVRSQATALGVTFGDPAAFETMRSTLADERAETGQRREALVALVKARDAKLAPTLQAIVSERALRGDALRALAVYDDPRTPEVVLAAYPRLDPSTRRDALNTLAARADYAKALLAAVGDRRVSSADVSADLIRTLRNHKDRDLDLLIGKVWGTARETSGDRAKLIARYRAIVQRSYSEPRDLSLGRAVFAKTCAQCHILFDAGQKVGPELTGSNRADLDYILSNVLDPSALIGNDYLAHTIATTDGRVLTGIIRAEDNDSITLVTANETLTVPKSDVEDRRQSEQSMMPEDLWKPLADHEVRSLVAYLASPAQVPMLATAENVAGFYNGRDLAGWQGNPSLWKVEDGEIVGKTTGLSRNEFLKSDLTAGDFTLSLQVKLVANEGNSGVQFRSEALPDGEMKGYQADVGPGWWGKLYEENGRALLWKESGESHVKPGEWNTYEIIARASKIQTKINGHTCVDLDDPEGERRGIFAFQLHSGGPTEVRFKDIRLEVGPAVTAP
jgi:putative membrane-bound dehydrogenase-like protein